MQAKPVIIYDRTGQRGVIEAPAELKDKTRTDVMLRLDDGRAVSVPKSMLKADKDGMYTLDLTLADLDRTGAAQQAEDQMVIPVVREELVVDKRTVEKGRVRVFKTVSEREEIIDEPLLHDEVEVERVAVNQIIPEPMVTRQEGDTMIIPVLEEVLVVEKRLLLKEEIHVRKVTRQARHAEHVTLREEQVEVERIGLPDQPLTGTNSTGNT